MSTRTKSHYAWKIVLGCFIIMCFGLCAVMNCFGLYVKPVTEDLGISRQSFSLVSTVMSMTMMVLSFFIGKVFNRFDIKRVMMISSIGLSASYICYSMASDVNMFYVISIFVGLFLGLITQVPCSMLITNWFNDKRGMALGLVFMGSGLGGLLLNPLISTLMTTFGWRKTYLSVGILMAVTLIPTTFFLIKSKPSDIGLEPLGGAVVNEGGVSEENDGMTMAEARKDKRFWLMLALTCLTVMACYGVMQHLTSYLSDIGFSYAMAANIGAINMGVLAFGKLALGRIYDQMGPSKATSISLICMAASSIALALSSGSAIMLVVFIPLFGLGCAFTTVAYPILTSYMFGRKDYGSIFGIVNAANSIGCAIGAPLAATIFDKMGSYTYAWYLGAALGIASLLISLVMLRPAKAKQTV